MNTLDQFDDPTISDSLSSRADQEVVSSAFGDAMLDAVRTSTKKRRVHRRLAVGGASALTVAALAFTVLPGGGLVGGRKGAGDIAPAATTSASLDPASVAIRDKILALPTSDTPDIGLARLTEKRVGNRSTMTFASGQVYEVPSGISRPLISWQDDLGAVIHAKRYDANVTDPRQLRPEQDDQFAVALFVRPDGSTLTLPCVSRGFGTVTKHDFSEAAVLAPDGSVTIVDRVEGRVVRTLTGAVAIPDRTYLPQLLWTGAGIIVNTTTSAGTTEVLHDSVTWKVVREWTLPRFARSLLAQDPNTLIVNLQNGTAQLVDAATGTVKLERKVDPGDGFAETSPRREWVTIGLEVMDTNTLTTKVTLPFRTNMGAWSWVDDEWLHTQASMESGGNQNGDRYAAACSVKTGECRHITSMDEDLPKPTQEN